MARSLAEHNRTLAQRLAGVGLECSVLPDGDANSDIAIIAESPGQKDIDMRLPLVGSGGSRLLWDALGKFGIRRQHCYMTYVVKKQLVENVKQNKKGVSRNELSHWKGVLDWELAQLPNVKYLLVLGDIPLQATVGVSGIDSWRGSVVGDDKHTLIIAHNPSMLMRKPSLEPIFLLDVSKLDMVRRGQWKEHNIVTYYDPSPSEAISWCDKMIQEGRPISFDIEVISNETACIGFANNAHEAMCINFRGRNDNRWSLDTERKVRLSIQRVLRYSTTKLVAQNGGFDCGWLWYKDRIKAKSLWLDTLLAHHTLHPTWPHNLGFLTAQYTTHPFYKDEKDAWREGNDISTFWQYNGKDCCITWEVARRLEQELVQQNMWDFFRNHVMRLQPHLISATVLGNAVDTAMREELNTSYSNDVNKLAIAFRDAARVATGDSTIDPNPNSPKQLAELFFQKLRLVGKTAKTDEANRNAMIENPRTSEVARKMLIILNDYKEQHKLLSTYISAAVDADGRMRSDYKQYGTQFVPGRLSSGSTLWGSGMNLQNQPERLRGMFIADRMMFND